MPGAGRTHGPRAIKKHAAEPQVQPKHPAFPAHFNGLYVVSPVRPGFVVTVIGAMRKHHRQIGTCIGAPGPHDFAVRDTSFVS